MADAHSEAVDTGAPPVAICCAASDEAAVRETADALEARGHQVQLVVGVDGDSEVLTGAIAAQQGRGLFVLCRSHSLDRNAVDSLREILRSHDVPFGRTLTLAVDTQRPREVEERIVSVLRRMVTGRADGRPRTWGSAVPLQEEDPDTTIRRPGKASGGSDPAAVLIGLGTEPENADPYASTSQIEVAEREHAALPVPYMGADHTAVGPSPLLRSQAKPAIPAMPPMRVKPPIPAMPPMRAKPVMPAIPAPAAASSPMLAKPAPAVASSSVSPMPAPAAASSPMPVMPAPAVASSPMPVMPAPAAASSPMPVMPAPAAPSPALEPLSPHGSSVDSGGSLGFEAADPMSEAMAGYTPPPVSAAPDESSADFEPPLTVGGRMGRALGSPAGLAVVLGGLVVVVVVALSVSLLGGDDGEDGKVASASATPTTKDDAKPKADASQKAADDGGTTATKSVSKAKDAGEAEAGDAEAGDAEAGDARPPAAAADPGEPPIPARTFDPEDDPPEVVDALREREVRAIDIFLVAPERKGNLTYDQAVTYCGKLEIAGLKGWRVPAIGELNSVAGAKMLGKSVYWSSTPGDSFGDERLVLNGKKKTISAVTKGWDGAKIVCIRPRQPS